MKKFKEILKDYVIPCIIIAVVGLLVFLGVAGLCEKIMW